MSEPYLTVPEDPRKPACVIKEVLHFFQEQVCVAERRETWLGWDGWVDTAPAALSETDADNPPQTPKPAP